MPQESVLSPLLWNLRYDQVLRQVELPQDCQIICYADDTIVLASERDWEEACIIAELCDAGNTSVRFSGDPPEI